MILVHHLHLLAMVPQHKEIKATDKFVVALYVRAARKQTEATA